MFYNPHHRPCLSAIYVGAISQQHCLDKRARLLLIEYLHSLQVIDPPGPYPINGHYFHSVIARSYEKHATTLKQNQVTTLYWAWWVTEFAMLVLHFITWFFSEKAEGWDISWWLKICVWQFKFLFISVCHPKHWISYLFIEPIERPFPIFLYFSFLRCAQPEGLMVIRESQRNILQLAIGCWPLSQNRKLYWPHFSFI